MVALVSDPAALADALCTAAFDPAAALASIAKDQDSGNSNNNAVSVAAAATRARALRRRLTESLLRELQHSALGADGAPDDNLNALGLGIGLAGQGRGLSDPAAVASVLLAHLAALRGAAAAGPGGLRASLDSGHFACSLSLLHPTSKRSNDGDNGNATSAAAVVVRVPPLPTRLEHLRALAQCSPLLVSALEPSERAAYATQLLPPLLRLATHQDYLVRAPALHGAALLCALLGPALAPATGRAALEALLAALLRTCDGDWVSGVAAARYGVRGWVGADVVVQLDLVNSAIARAQRGERHGGSGRSAVRGGRGSGEDDADAVAVRAEAPAVAARFGVPLSALAGVRLTGLGADSDSDSEAETNTDTDAESVRAIDAVLARAAAENDYFVPNMSVKTSIHDSVAVPPSNAPLAVRAAAARRALRRQAWAVRARERATAVAKGLAEASRDDALLRADILSQRAVAQQQAQQQPLQAPSADSIAEQLRRLEVAQQLGSGAGGAAGADADEKRVLALLQDSKETRERDAAAVLGDLELSPQRRRLLLAVVAAEVEATRLLLARAVTVLLTLCGLEPELLRGIADAQTLDALQTLPGDVGNRGGIPAKSKGAFVLGEVSRFVDTVLRAVDEFFAEGDDDEDNL